MTVANNIFTKMDDIHNIDRSIEFAILSWRVHFYNRISEIIQKWSITIIF